MEGQPNWITTSQVLERLSAAGYPNRTDRQLERRREAHLLPSVAQEQISQGSITWHPPETARQAIAIERCLEVKERFDFAGPLLWAAGFEVGERYYAERLERANQFLEGGRSRLVSGWLAEWRRTRPTGRR